MKELKHIETDKLIQYKTCYEFNLTLDEKIEEGNKVKFKHEGIEYYGEVVSIEEFNGKQTVKLNKL